jgi:hypothetical protein
MDIDKNKLIVKIALELQEGSSRMKVPTELDDSHLRDEGLLNASCASFMLPQKMADCM